MRVLVVVLVVVVVVTGGKQSQLQVLNLSLNFDNIFGGADLPLNR